MDEFPPKPRTESESQPEINYVKLTTLLAANNKMQEVGNLNILRKKLKDPNVQSRDPDLLREALTVLAKISNNEEVTPALFEGNTQITFNSLGGTTDKASVVGHVVATVLQSL